MRKSDEKTEMRLTIWDNTMFIYPCVVFPFPSLGCVFFSITVTTSGEVPQGYLLSPEYVWRWPNNGPAVNKRSAANCKLGQLCSRDTSLIQDLGTPTAVLLCLLSTPLATDTVTCWQITLLVKYTREMNTFNFNNVRAHTPHIWYSRDTNSIKNYIFRKTFQVHFPAERLNVIFLAASRRHRLILATTIVERRKNAN